MVLVVTLAGRGYNPIYTVYIQFCQTRLLWCWWCPGSAKHGRGLGIDSGPTCAFRRPAESLHKIPTSWAWERTCRKTGNSTGVEKESWGSSLELFLLKVIISIHWFSASQVFHMLQLPDDLWHRHFLTATQHSTTAFRFEKTMWFHVLWISLKSEKGLHISDIPNRQVQFIFLWATLRHHRPSRLCWPAALVRSCAYFNKHLWY